MSFGKLVLVSKWHLVQSPYRICNWYFVNCDTAGKYQKAEEKVRVFDHWAPGCDYWEGIISLCHIKLWVMINSIFMVVTLSFDHRNWMGANLGREFGTSGLSLLPVGGNGSGGRLVVHQSWFDPHHGPYVTVSLAITPSCSRWSGYLAWQLLTSVSKCGWMRSKTVLRWKIII